MFDSCSEHLLYTIKNKKDTKLLTTDNRWTTTTHLLSTGARSVDLAATQPTVWGACRFGFMDIPSLKHIARQKDFNYGKTSRLVSDLLGTYSNKTKLLERWNNVRADALAFSRPLSARYFKGPLRQRGKAHRNTKKDRKYLKIIRLLRNRRRWRLRVLNLNWDLPNVYVDAHNPSPVTRESMVYQTVPVGGVVTYYNRTSGTRLVTSHKSVNPSKQVPLFENKLSWGPYEQSNWKLKRALLWALGQVPKLRKINRKGRPKAFYFILRKGQKFIEVNAISRRSTDRGLIDTSRYTNSDYLQLKRSITHLNARLKLRQTFMARCSVFFYKKRRTQVGGWLVYSRKNSTRARKDPQKSILLRYATWRAQRASGWLYKSTPTGKSHPQIPLATPKHTYLYRTLTQKTIRYSSKIRLVQHAERDRTARPWVVKRKKARPLLRNRDKWYLRKRNRKPVRAFALRVRNCYRKINQRKVTKLVKRARRKRFFQKRWKFKKSKVTARYRFFWKLFYTNLSKIAKPQYIYDLRYTPYWQRTKPLVLREFQFISRRYGTDEVLTGSKRYGLGALPNAKLLGYVRGSGGSLQDRRAKGLRARNAVKLGPTLGRRSWRLLLRNKNRKASNQIKLRSVRGRFEKKINVTSVSIPLSNRKLYTFKSARTGTWHPTNRRLGVIKATSLASVEVDFRYKKGVKRDAKPFNLAKGTYGTDEYLATSIQIKRIRGRKRRTRRTKRVRSKFTLHKPMRVKKYYRSLRTVRWRRALIFYKKLTRKKPNVKVRSDLWDLRYRPVARIGKRKFTRVKGKRKKILLRFWAKLPLRKISFYQRKQVVPIRGLKRRKGSTGATPKTSRYKRRAGMCKARKWAFYRLRKKKLKKKFKEVNSLKLKNIKRRRAGAAARLLRKRRPTRRKRYNNVRRYKRRTPKPKGRRPRKRLNHGIALIYQKRVRAFSRSNRQKRKVRRTITRADRFLRVLRGFTATRGPANKATPRNTNRSVQQAFRRKRFWFLTKSRFRGLGARGKAEMTARLRRGKLKLVKRKRKPRRRRPRRKSVFSFKKKYRSVFRWYSRSLKARHRAKVHAGRARLANYPSGQDVRPRQRAVIALYKSLARGTVVSNYSSRTSMSTGRPRPSSKTVYSHITSFKKKLNLKLLNVCNDIGGLDIIFKDIKPLYRHFGRKGLFLVKRNDFMVAIAIMLLLRETEQWAKLLAKAIKRLGFKQQRRLLRAVFLFFRKWNAFTWTYSNIVGLYFKLQGIICVRGGFRKRNYKFSYGLVPSNTYNLSYYMHNRLLWNRAGAVGLKTMLVSKK